MDKIKEQFIEPVKRFENRDPELYQELEEKFLTASDDLTEAPLPLEFIEENAFLDEAGTATIDGRRIIETIVLPRARPVMVIRDNRATAEFLGPDSQVWAQRIISAQSILDKVIPAVGRIEVNNHPDFPWVGTGWLVAGDIIVTNRHVAREFGKRSGQEFTFRAGLNGGPMTSRIDFLEEDQRFSSLEYDVSSILWIAPPDESDVAFLRIAPRGGNLQLPLPIPLTENIEEDAFVATIGYPARDPRVPDQELVKHIFGDLYDKKRLAPGQVTGVETDEIRHDCSTLGGNSGSVVVSLTSGEAVGLHFAGLFMEANFAVSAPKIRSLLKSAQQNAALRIDSAPKPNPAPFTPGLLTEANSYTFQVQIPLEITIKVGTPVMPGMPVPVVVNTPPDAGDVHERALNALREALAGSEDVVEMRLGYRFKRGWITDEKVIVVEVREKLSVSELQAAGNPVIPTQIMGVGVDVRTAALPEQLEHLGFNLLSLEAPPRPGQYREPPHLSLTPVKERMKAVFHVSPDSGFPNLEKFLGRVRRTLTATMYEWVPNHISRAIVAAIKPGNRVLTMVTQKNTPAGGTKSAIEDLKTQLPENKFKHVWASVGAGKLIPSAYHIKVASRDGEEVWLSSGNWKSSNQPEIDPAGQNSTAIAPLRDRNREWHAIIENATLAKLFQSYIEFDFSEAQRVPLTEGLVETLPDLFVPEAAFEEALEGTVQVRYFDPLEIDRELEIQPLLTPDRDIRGNRLFMDFAIEMIKKGTRRIYVENQSFNLLGEGDNFDQFENFFKILRDKQDAGVDVKVIFRDAREFGRGSLVSQQRLLERIKDFGFDTSTESLRVQHGCHTKGIIVDSKEVMLGSHNLTNQGSLLNRDASLLVRDAEVAAYFEEIFKYDWNNLARQEADELVGGVRIAQPGEETPVGFRRVSAGELFV